MKTLKYYLIILLGLLILGCKHEIKNKFLSKNIQDFSSGSCYIFIDINYKNDIYTIVLPNKTLFDNMNCYLYDNKLSETDYINKVSKVITEKGQIEFNDSIYYILKGRILQKDLALKYDKIDIIKSGYILQYGNLADSIDRDNETAIIYTLLKKELKNCFQDCESGKTVFLHIQI